MSRLALFLALLAVGFGTRTDAAPITVFFTGSVILVDDPGSRLDGSITVGTPFSGSLSYDPAALADTLPDPSEGAYYPDPADFSFSVVIGSYSLAYDSGSAGLVEIGVHDNAPLFLHDTYNVVPNGLTGLESIAGLVDSSLQVFLGDSTQTALTSDSLSAVPLTTAAWDLRSFLLDLRVDAPSLSEASVEGDIEFLAVPEPEGGLLLALGGAAALAAARRRD